MSHRATKAARRSVREAVPLSLPGEPNVHATVNTPFASYGWGQGYNAADQSTMRGFVYFPQLDTRKELTTYTRTEILRRARYLDANVGFAGRIINGLSRMVAGTGLMIRPTTDDREWNAERQQLFEERNGSRYVFDTGGRWDFYSSQRGVMRCRYRDGDIGGAFVRSEAGLARCSFFEAHRIASGRVSSEEMDRVIDGVIIDRNNAAVAYRITGDADTQVDIPVGQFFYVGDYASAGKHRTPSILHRACNHLIDITEINAATKKGIKISNQIAYYIGQAATVSGSGIPPMGEGANPKVQVTLSDGTKRTLEQLLSQGGEIPGLPAGIELKQLLDERPHPNSAEFLKSLARDIAWGTDMSPEVLWDIAALGGANTRYVMADAQSFIDLEQQNLCDSYVCRYYVFDTALEIAAGRIRQPRDSRWWKHCVIPPSRWTVDRGRDGKLYLEQVRSGALTFRRMLGWEGLDSEHELTEWLDEMKFVGDEAVARGLDREKTIDRIYGRPGAAAQSASATPDPASQDEPASGEDMPMKPGMQPGDSTGED